MGKHSVHRRLFFLCWPQFQRLVRQLKDLLQQRKVTIEIHWVASELNPADLPSRERWAGPVTCSPQREHCDSQHDGSPQGHVQGGLDGMLRHDSVPQVRSRGTAASHARGTPRGRGHLQSTGTPPRALSGLVQPSVAFNPSSSSSHSPQSTVP